MRDESSLEGFGGWEERRPRQRLVDSYDDEPMLTRDGLAELREMGNKHPTSVTLMTYVHEPPPIQTEPGPPHTRFTDVIVVQDLHGELRHELPLNRTQPSFAHLTPYLSR